MLKREVMEGEKAEDALKKIAKAAKTALRAAQSKPVRSDPVALPVSDGELSSSNDYDGNGSDDSCPVDALAEVRNQRATGQEERINGGTLE